MRIILGIYLLLMAPQAWAGGAALVCVFKPSGDRFNLVTVDDVDYIQWENGKLEEVISKFENPNLSITQFGSEKTFNLFYNAKVGLGYGGYIDFNGKEIKGTVQCIKGSHDIN